MWFFLVYDSPAQHPRISDEEREYIEKALNARDREKVSFCKSSFIFTSFCCQIWKLQQYHDFIKKVENFTTIPCVYQAELKMRNYWIAGIAFCK